MTPPQERLRLDYEALRTALMELSAGDAAALRSLERKFEQLDESLWFNDVSYEVARDELFLECYDCLPVDE